MSPREASVGAGTPYCCQRHAAERPKPSRNRPSVSDCRVWPIDASTMGWRTPGTVTAAPIFTRSVTWLIAPASEGRSLVSKRSPIHTVPKPRASVVRAWSSAGRGSCTPPGST